MSDQADRLRMLVENGSADSLATIVPPSIPTGVVSYRPRPQMRGVAPGLGGSGGGAAPIKLARAIAITSGKGGVGKSNLAVNLAVALSAAGQKVCLIDADLGMANADVLCNLSPRRTLLHVVTGRARLADVALLAPGGFRLIPGASGVAGMADLGERQRLMVLRQLAALERAADIILIDCAAGISTNVIAFAAAAHSTLVTTTPEPTAITDAYGMVKALLRRTPSAQVRLVVNMVTSEEEGRGVHERMNRVTMSFLEREIGFAGSIPRDPSVPSAVRCRLPFTLYAPQSPATRAIHELARDIIGGETSAATSRGRSGFFARLVSWLAES